MIISNLLLRREKGDVIKRRVRKKVKSVFAVYSNYLSKTEVYSVKQHEVN